MESPEGKPCKYCSGVIIKSGFTASGSPRYRCNKCKRSPGVARIGPKPQGETVMSGAERQAKFQQRKRAGLTKAMGPKKRRPADLDIPGAYVEERMKTKKVSASRLATVLGVSELYVRELIKGRRVISRGVAVRLGRVLGPDTHYWVEKEEYYRAQLFYYDSDAYKKTGLPFSEAFKSVAH